MNTPVPYILIRLRGQKAKQRQYLLPVQGSCGLSHLSSCFLSAVGCDCMIVIFWIFFFLQFLAHISLPREGYKNQNYFPQKQVIETVIFPCLSVLELAMKKFSGLPFTSCQRGLPLPGRRNAV